MRKRQPSRLAAVLAGLLTADNSPLPAAAELGILFGGMILGTVCSATLYKTSQKE